MIHIIKEGEIRRVGLNLYRAKGGFVAVWAWYDAVKYTMSFRRFRLRLHIKPWLLRTSGRFNVVDEYLMDYGLSLVSREELVDLRALQDSRMRINEPLAYIKPK